MKARMPYIITLTCLSLLMSGLLSDSLNASDVSAEKTKFLVVSSYHREYIWTQETNRGLSDAMIKFGYFDHEDQVDTYTRDDYIETSRAIVKKVWMDTKRKTDKESLAIKTAQIVEIAKQFNPDLLFLGDDNATNYIGNQFLDSDIPIVFWGVNSNPLKYGLVERRDRPGHNVTGVYQPGFILESLQLLKTLAPEAKTLAVLSDDSATGRANVKTVAHLARKGVLPLELVENYSTSDFQTWKERVLDLQNKVDALFLGHYASFKDREGNPISPEDAAKWYLKNSRIPEAMAERQFVEQGILCTADDSGYKQGFEAVVIANDILTKKADPSTYPPVAPSRGALLVNRQRAKMLGIVITPDMGVEEFIEKMLPLK